MKDSNNSQVRQYKTVNRSSAVTFKQQLENLCDEREDLWGNEVTAKLSRVVDLRAADAQYHVPSYNCFRIVSVTRPSITETFEEAVRSVLSIMAQNATESWTTSKLYVMYVAASGTVSRLQFVSNVTVMSCLCSTSRTSWRNLVSKIRSEVKAKPRNVDYKLSDYVHPKVIETTSATLRSLVCSLVSGGEITNPSLTLAQLVHSAAC